MKLIALNLRNFLSYSDQHISFKSLEGVVFLIGRVEDDASKSNGSGKSAIFDAISWVLFGSSRTSDDDELIKKGEKQVEVILDFELDEKTYNVSRIKKLGKSQTLAFSCMTAGVSLTGNAVKETQSKIIEVLGLDNELYENTVFARQGRIDEFPRQTPAKRKQMLQDILKIDMYEKWENEAKEMARTYETQRETLKMVIEKGQNEIDVLTVGEADINQKKALLGAVQVKIKAVENDIAEKTDSYNNMKSAKQLLGKEQDNQSNIAGDIDRVNSQIKYIDENQQKEINKILQEKQADIDLVAGEEKVKSVLEEIASKLKVSESSMQHYEAMKQQEALLDNECRRVLGTIKDYDAELEKLRKKLNTFKELGDKCPLCYSTLNEEQKKSVEAEIVSEGKNKRDYLDKLKEEYDSAKTTAEKLRQEIKNISISPANIRELENDKAKYDRELINIQTAKNRIEFTDNKITETRAMFMRQKIELNFELKRKQSDLAKSVATIETYKTQLAGIDKMESELASVEEVRKTYVIEEKKVSEELHRMQYEYETKIKKTAELAMNKIKAEKVNSDAFIYSELSNAFGKDGIPLLIVENALAELQSEVMHQLNTLTDGTISVEFRTQKELKSGKTSDSLDIIVSDRSGSRDFNLYSGGEKMRIALAIRLGLSKLLSRRAGKKFDILIIDEISDLDSHGMGKFVDLIGTVAKEYKQIFVVSHLSDIKDRFSQVLQVVKDNNGSRIVS